MKNIFKLMVLLLLLLATGCGSNTDKPTQTDSHTTPTKIQVFFSQTSGAYYKGGADNIIVDSINQASKSIYLAMYNFTNKNIKQAIINAKARGLEVKIITDKKYKNTKVFKELADIGIKVVHDGTDDKTMHDKILVLDDRIVYVGSANYTVYAFYRNYENILKFDDKKIAQIYKNKITKLLVGDRSAVASYRSENINIYFSPEHNIENIIIQHIAKAKTSIQVLAFAFTNKLLSDSLIQAHKRGVAVEVVFDKDQDKYQNHSKYKELQKAGISVKFDTNPQKMHNKVMIFDDNVVLSGSYNFTRQANDKNDENVVLMTDKNIITKFKHEFEKIKN
jgi:phosphatidylserine/phosphatidylglycerophosphate/cardiolipin synthase-like enzyme